MLALNTVAIALAWPAGLRVNWTESMPRGLYRETAPCLERGALVMVCLEGAPARLGRERGYLPRGDCPSGVMPIVKEIVAVLEDRVNVDRSGLTVNGRPIPGTALLARDTLGRPLPHVAPGELRLSEDEFFVLGRASPRSWDSRYFGIVSLQQIHGSVAPWLIWKPSATTR
jgi:conjugative transfer signal peptidase TraF